LIQRNIFIPCLIITILFFSCAPAYKRHISEYKFDNKIVVPDYSKLDYWAAHPDKRDLSDSIPEPLKATTIKDSTVDVFFLHPTTFGTIENADLGWNAAINDSVINAKTDYTTILYQASAFNEYRVFAPRYRQANLVAYYSADTTNAKKAFDLAYADIKNAFQYYLDHYNHGRPIIIASHSQGTTHAEKLLKEFFDEKPLKNRLVAAYIIGMAIPKNYYAALKPCTDSAQTGCIIGWRTYKKEYEPDIVKKENGNSYVVNPLTWKTNDEYAPKNLNKGGVLTTFNKVAPEVADAQIHDDIIWANKPHFSGSILFTRKNYHIGDINLYYINIRENLRTRVAAFYKK
jgi:hypothetical protein